MANALKLNLKLINPDAEEKTIEESVLVDLSLNKQLILPKSLIDKLGLKKINTIHTQDTNGKILEQQCSKIYGEDLWGEITIDFDGKKNNLRVYVKDDPSQPTIGLAGLEMVLGYYVKFPIAEFIFRLAVLLFGLYLMLIQFPHDLKELNAVSPFSRHIVPGWELGSVMGHAAIELYPLFLLIAGIVCSIFGLVGIFKCTFSYLRGKKRLKTLFRTNEEK